MATQPTDRRAIEQFPVGVPPMATVSGILSRNDRSKLAAFIEFAIDLLDTLEGDADSEEDDPAGQCDEDGINTAHPISDGPGCSIGDPGEFGARQLRMVESEGA